MWVGWDGVEWVIFALIVKLYREQPDLRISTKSPCDLQSERCGAGFSRKTCLTCSTKPLASMDGFSQVGTLRSNVINVRHILTAKRGIASKAHSRFDVRKNHFHKFLRAFAFKGRKFDDGGPLQ